MNEELLVQHIKTFESGIKRQLYAQNEMHINHALDNDKKFKEVNNNIDNIQQTINMLEKKLEQVSTVYSDEDLYNLFENGLTYKKISAKTGIPYGTVRGKVSRYKRHLFSDMRV